MVFDLTLDRVQNTRFRNTFNTLIKQLAKETYLMEKQIKTYLLIYYKFSLNNGLSKDKKLNQHMTKPQLCNFLQLYFNINDSCIIQNITRVASHDGGILSSATAWIKLLNVYASESLDVHIQFCFNVYDIYSEGYLNRHVVSIFTDNYFLGNDEETEEYSGDMLNMLMNRFDVDKDGIISFDDYKTTVYKTPALLQFLGICIPPRSTIEQIFSKELFVNNPERLPDPTDCSQ